MRGREEPKGPASFCRRSLRQRRQAEHRPRILGNHQNAGDIGGGLVVTMPRLKDLEDPEVGPMLRRPRGRGPGGQAEKVAKFLQHRSAGLHGPGRHGAGAPQTRDSCSPF